MFPILLLLAHITAATNLYVSSYGGVLDSIQLTEDAGQAELALTATEYGCAPSPAWLTFDSNSRILYCLDEGLFQTNGSVASFVASEDGGLKMIERKLIPSGPSGAVLYGSGSSQKLAISHYNGSALTLWNADSRGVMSSDESYFFYQTEPGPGPRQTAPHQHEVLLDPTGEYLISLAFGEDEIQVFSINGSDIHELPSSKVAPGSGPRHGAFWSPEGRNSTTSLYFFLVAEITSALTTYAVSYTGTGMNFTQVAVTNTYGGVVVPMGNGPAEIEVSPDNRFVVVSNRNGTATLHASLKFGSSVEEYWDTLASFRPLPNGTLVLEELVPAGGGFPRNFVFNKAGDRAAVGLQSNQRIVVFSRDIESGRFGSILANMTINGEPNCLIWDD